MKISEEMEKDAVVCAIEGEINITTSPELRKLFDKFIRSNIKKVIIDFKNVSYIDSSGLATLIEMLQRLKKIEGSLKLVSMPQKIKNIFEITKLDKLFEIFETKEEALKTF